MYKINDDLSIYVTRGDIVIMSVSAEYEGNPYTFKVGELLRIKVFKKKNCSEVVLQKDFPITAEGQSVQIFLTKEDTKFGNVISKPADYWYEVELNPLSDPQTIIGYDEDGAKVFKLFPEGADEELEHYEPGEEELLQRYMDGELDLTSTHPVENQAIARAIIGLGGDVERFGDDLAFEKVRITNLMTGNTVDNETKDIRVGIDGTTYSSAGDSMRTQIANNRSLMCDTETVPLKKGSAVFDVVAGAYINGTYGIQSLADYSISYFKAKEKLNFYIEGEYAYLTIALINGGINGKVTAFYRDATLPTADNPLSVNSGVTVAISYNNMASFTVHHNSVFLGYKTGRAFSLDERTENKLLEPANRLRNDVVNDASFGIGNKSNSVFAAVDGYANAIGIITDADVAMYKTYHATADRDFECYFEETLGSYLSLCLYDGEFQKNFIARYRETDIPTAETPLTVKKGQTIAVTVVNGEDFKLFANNSYFTVTISEKIVKGIANLTKKPIVQYKTVIGANTTERITVYIPTVVGFVGYDFAHVVNNSINANSWRIIRAFSCDDDFVERFDITNPGEWEMAIQIQGRDDFIGGSLHGDEMMTSISFIVDGIKKAVTDMTERKEFSTLRIVESTKMYDPADNKTHVATHGKEYIFTEKGLALRQLVEWHTKQSIGASYMTMLPIYRGNDAYSERQITDTFYSNRDYTEYDVSVPFESPAYNFVPNIRSATIYSNKSGVCATVEMLRNPDTKGGNFFKVSESDQYNKFYFTCAGLGETHLTEIGERWETETQYSISVNKGTDNYPETSDDAAFTFDQRDGEYTFEKGMTWAEFINSDYNAPTDEWGDHFFHTDFSDSSLVAWYGMAIHLNGSTVKLTDTIVEDGYYTL